MELINNRENISNVKIKAICAHINIVMQHLGATLVQQTIKSAKKEVMSFISKGLIPKSNQLLDVIWEMTVSQTLIKLTIRLNPNQSCTSSRLCLFFQGKKDEVCQFVYQINNLKINDSDGLFYFGQETGEIGFQAKIYGFKFISTAQKLLSFLRSKISSAQNIFLEELQNLIFYYKIPDISLHHYENQIPQSNHLPIKRYHDKITLLRHHFQLRLNKDKPNQYMCDPNVTKCILEYFNFMQGFNYIHPQLAQAMMNQSSSRIQHQFKQQISLLIGDLQKYQTNNFDPILSTIKIKQKTKEQLIDCGGFSSIFSGLYSFYPQASIHKTVNQAIQFKGVLRTSFLVKKRGQQQKIPLALQNEFNFLFSVRNRVCPYLAKYYNNYNLRPFSDGQVYLQFYPSSFADCHLREAQKLKIMEDICMGLLFMNREGIIHRDLKEMNIMIDRNKRGRIIDFGSVSGIAGMHRFKPVDNKVRSTQGYFIPYLELIKKLPFIENKINRIDYYSHRNFDHFALGKIFHNQFYLDHIVGDSHFLRHNLHYLAQKCMTEDPDDRLTIQQITVFLRQLMIYNDLRKEFWKFKASQKSRVHAFGNLIGDKDIVFKEKQICTEPKIYEKQKLNVS